MKSVGWVYNEVSIINGYSSKVFGLYILFHIFYRQTSAKNLEYNNMFRHIPSKQLHVSNPTYWLESRFHFSFADYFNPNNMQFGALRVLNDDLVQPKSGFDTHPHRDMEIVTYVVDGHLTHKDSMGTEETLGRGCIQYMSAGTGVRHSEKNKRNEMLRFLQIWIQPNKRGLKPNYGSRAFSEVDRRNKLQHILTSYENVKDDAGQGVIPIHQDANIYVSEMDPAQSLDFELQKGRRAYMVCIEGSLNVNAIKMNARDALEVVADDSTALKMNMKADEKEGSHFMLIDLA